MEFNKAAAEAAIQDCINKNLAPHLVTNGVLEEGHRVMFLGKCEALQGYFVEQAAQGLSYKTLKENIRQKIEELKAAIDKAEADYNRYYPPQGHTTMTVIHLIPGSPEDTEDDLTTWKRTPEERSNIPSPGLFHFVRFKNTVLINFLEFLIKEFRQREAEAQLPSQEERLALEARANNILEQALEKAEADLQTLISDTLPKQLAQRPQAEHAQYFSTKAQELRAWLKESYKPWFEAEASTLAGHLLVNAYVRSLDATWLKNRIAERFVVTRYIEHLVALADAGTQQPQAKKGPGKPEATTKKWALYYWYQWNAGLLPDLDPGVGKKKRVQELAEKHGVSDSNLLQTFNAASENNIDERKNPRRNPDNIRQVIELLADYPEALKQAEKDLQQIDRQKK